MLNGGDVGDNLAVGGVSSVGIKVIDISKHFVGIDPFKEALQIGAEGGPVCLLHGAGLLILRVERVHPLKASLQKTVNRF